MVEPLQCDVVPVNFTLKVNNYLVLQPFRTMVTPVMFLLYMYIFDFFLQEINLVRGKKNKSEPDNLQAHGGNLHQVHLKSNVHEHS